MAALAFPKPGIPQAETAARSPAALKKKANPALPRSFFQQALLKLLLAFDAVEGPRHRFQALGIDLPAAGYALPEVSLAYAHQGTVHHLQELAFVVAL